MCKVYIKDKNIVKDIMLMLGLNETIDQQAVTNGMRWYAHASR